jgi:predicted SprT family Zn-dependent metalloprotease
MGDASPLRQLLFNFVDSLKPGDTLRREARTIPLPRQVIEEPQPPPEPPPPLENGRDAALEAEARGLLDKLGIHEGVARLRVVWNPKLRSTAGYAKWPQWLIELNPRLREFDGQIERTMKHELAHLIAYARAGRKRIEPHGPEWRKACADIGIPDESARHTLPLPRSKQERKFTYACSHCGFTVARVKKFRRHTACLACCKRHNRGRYDPRFQFVLK